MNEPTEVVASPTLAKIPGYEIQREIGRGGFGRVFKAFDLKMKRFVAIKEYGCTDGNTVDFFYSFIKKDGNDDK